MAAQEEELVLRLFFRRLFPVQGRSDLAVETLPLRHVRSAIGSERICLVVPLEQTEIRCSLPNVSE